MVASAKAVVRSGTHISSKEAPRKRRLKDFERRKERTSAREASESRSGIATMVMRRKKGVRGGARAQTGREAVNR